jgi:hypothetical protein
MEFAFDIIAVDDASQDIDRLYLHVGRISRKFETAKD